MWALPCAAPAAVPMRVARGYFSGVEDAGKDLVRAGPPLVVVHGAVASSGVGVDGAAGIGAHDGEQVGEARPYSVRRTTLILRNLDGGPSLEYPGGSEISRR